MPPAPPSSPRRELLRRQGCLNPRPDTVVDPLFQGSDFFNPDDLMQVKYEMLRRVSGDGLSVTQAAARFGLSRVSFYLAREAFERAGLEGLLPGKRGPRGRHKLTAEVVAWLRERQRTAPDSSPAALALGVHERFGITIHSRSIQRALATSEKKRT
jgi:transposase